ncbi:MAG: cupin domain-containing protein [Gammaproteobacteria bacterium]|nr:cupin domain-containing protein [Gammaproteobacteria bacterium]
MTDVVITCDDLQAALDFYTGPLGFRIDTIFPADAPREARLSGHGLTVAMHGAPAPARDRYEPAVVVTRQGDGGFGAGRAGMQYRDFLPDRFGGRVIASHIRIPDGGPVADYVHHHDVGFQVIFCVKGWVRVVYEDQGEPMRMQAGDCFLQPPHIRHRVLECSDGMEVVEIASPAEHETSVDHDMSLPNGVIDPARVFGGQRFVFSEATAAVWQDAGIPGLVCRDTGIGAATGGTGSVKVLRAPGGCDALPLGHDGEFRFVFVLKGHTAELAAGDACAVSPGIDYSLERLSPGFEALDVCLGVGSGSEWGRIRVGVGSDPGIRPRSDP